MNAESPSPILRTSRSAALAVCLAAVVVGWPALSGTHDSGDDAHLIFNHGLVNHPSLEHAVRLFQIIHRDLYQPIPLLTFQIEFAFQQGHLGEPDHLDRLVASMHRTNLLIHALNGVLVLALFTRIFQRRWPALLVAGMFVCHPLTVECYTWLNGRMLMLSATFSLAALLAAWTWRERTRFDRTFDASGNSWGWAAVIALCTMLAMMCKVQPGLVVLIGLVWLWPADPARSLRFDLLKCAHTWIVGCGLAAIVVAFIAINWQATEQSRMFEGAEQQLHGPSAARVCQALGWYVLHYIWPTGLAPWYAPPTTVAWSDPAVVQSVVLLAAAGLVVVVAARWSRVGWLGAAWFLAAVAATLPIVPARNLLVADRYVYLANIGLHWILAAAIVASSRVLLSRMAPAARLVAPVILLAAWGLLSRQVVTYYIDDESRITRMIDVSPNYSTLLTSWGWHLFENGDYTGAIAKADEELQKYPDDDHACSRALNLRGLARFRLTGDVGAARADMQAALRRVPDYVKGLYRLALVEQESGDPAAAEQHLRRAVDLSNNEFNPAIKLLARLCRRRGAWSEARTLYETALTNSNGFDVQAIDEICQIDLEQGRYVKVVKRYAALLSWHRRASGSRVRLAIALSQLGRLHEAGEQCEIALQDDPDNFEAVFNLALINEKLLEEAASMEQARMLLEAARQHYIRALELRPRNRVALAGASRILQRSNRAPAALELWQRAAAASPEAADLRAGVGLAAWYAADLSLAARSAQDALESQPDLPDARLVQCLVAMSQGRAEALTEAAALLVASEPGPLVCEYGLDATEFHTVVDPGSPWPYHVTAVILAIQKRFDVAQLARESFERMCQDEAAERELRVLLENISRGLPPGIQNLGTVGPTDPQQGTRPGSPPDSSTGQTQDHE